MNHIQRHIDHSARNFLKRTIAAQLHFVGLAVAATGLVVLMHFARLNQDWRHFWACLIFGLTGVGVFLASAVYHLLSDGFTISNSLRQSLKDLDHSAIFLFIAGSYTPFVINVFSPPWDKILLVSVWIIGVLGVFYIYFRNRLPSWARNRFVYTSIFLMMGWALLIRIGDALAKLPMSGLYLLIAGGLCYTVGAVVYATKWPNPIRHIFGFHEIWHVFVMAGFLFHYFLILNFYL